MVGRLSINTNSNRRSKKDMESQQNILDFHPTMEDYEYIRTWMMDAYNEELPNSTLIKAVSYDDFKNGSIVVYRINGKAEAFAMFRAFSKVVRFEILYLNYKYHHKGIGRHIMHELINHFKQNGIVVAEVYQPSLNGLRLAKELGFSEIKDNSSKDILTKFLVDSREQSKRAKRRLVLWKGDYGKKRVDYSWSLNFSRDKRPILTYAYKDWTYGIVYNDITKPIDVVKHLEDNHCGEYLYLDEDIFRDLAAYAAPPYS